MKRLAVALLTIGILVGCGGRPPSEVSNQAKGWVGRLQRAAKARDKDEISEICGQIHEPQRKFTELEMRLFDQVCDFCENENWENAESHLSVMAGKTN